MTIPVCLEILYISLPKRHVLPHEMEVIPGKDCFRAKPTVININ